MGLFMIGFASGALAVFCLAIYTGSRARLRRNQALANFQTEIEVGRVGTETTPSPAEIYRAYCSDRGELVVEEVERRLIELDPGPGFRPSVDRVLELLSEFKRNPFLLYGELATLAAMKAKVADGEV